MDQSEIRERLTAIQIASSQLIEHLSRDPSWQAREPLLVGNCLPMISDLIACNVAFVDLFEDAPERDDILVLVKICDQVLLSGQLALDMQALLLASLGPVMVGVGEVEDLEAYKERYRAILEQIEREAPQ